MSEDIINDITRRKFLMKIGILLGGVASIAAGIPIIGALFAPLAKKKKETWRTIGLPNDFQIGSTILVKFINSDPLPYSGITAESAAWLRRNSANDFIAFSANCTHLGCPVRWEKEAELFMCPCHGGVYYKDGTVAAGPPPKELTKYSVRIYNGEVQLLTAPIPITTITATKK
jgi:menaquinol-cytochrome c reductase iron-sulfur subunit